LGPDETAPGAPSAPAAAAGADLGFSPGYTPSSSSSRPSASEVVYGLPVGKSRLIQALKRVLIAVGLVATFYIGWFVVEVLRGLYKPDGSDLWDGGASDEEEPNNERLTSGLIGLLLDLAVPVCGYFGVMHSNRQLTCCFCSCNLFRGLWAVVALSKPLLDGRVEASLANLRSLILLILCCAAFWYGHHLYQLLSHERHPIYVMRPLVGEVVSGGQARSSGSGAHISRGGIPPARTADSGETTIETTIGAVIASGRSA